MQYVCPGTVVYKQKASALVQKFRHLVGGKKARYVTKEYDLDLTYITPRLIAMSFPSSGLQATYRNNVIDVANLLTSKHQNHYMVFNVSEKSYDIAPFNDQVLDFGWPDHMAPPLERLCIICKSIDSWLKTDTRNVVVVHCKVRIRGTRVLEPGYEGISTGVRGY